MKKPKFHIESLLPRLEKRGSMYMSPFNYSTLVTYLVAFDVGLQEGGCPSELESFPRWLDDRIGYESNFHWSDRVKKQVAKHDEEKAIPLLFTLLREFFRDREAKPGTKGRPRKSKTKPGHKPSI